MGKGLAEDGTLTGIGVVPKPLQKPHPPIFQPFATSERSMRWCADEDITAIVPPVHEKLENHLLDVYADIDQELVASVYGGTVPGTLPEHFLVNRDGKIVFRLMGALPHNMAQIISDWLP